MKPLISLVVFTCSLAVCSASYHCEPGKGDDFPRQVCYVTECVEHIQKHIKKELDASFSYLYLATVFDEDSVNRPGLAKFLYESASEEREHAILMLDYLNLRGIPFEEGYTFELGKVDMIREMKDLSYKTALDTALNMEIYVTNKIHQIIDACANDFHGADVFTDPILTEQHDGVRKLQGAIKTFHDLTEGYEKTLDRTELSFAEYIFDRKLLNGNM